MKKEIKALLPLLEHKPLDMNRPAHRRRYALALMARRRFSALIEVRIPMYGRLNDQLADLVDRHFCYLPFTEVHYGARTCTVYCTIDDPLLVREAAQALSDQLTVAMDRQPRVSVYEADKAGKEVRHA